AARSPSKAASMRLVIASPLVAARFGSDLTHDLSGPPPSSNSVGYLCSGYLVTCSHHWIGSGDGARTSPSTSASRQYANRSSSNSRCLAENEANGPIRGLHRCPLAHGRVVDARRRPWSHFPSPTRPSSDLRPEARRKPRPCVWSLPLLWLQHVRSL